MIQLSDPVVVDDTNSERSAPSHSSTADHSRADDPVSLVLVLRGQIIDDLRGSNDLTFTRRFLDVSELHETFAGPQLSSETPKGDSCRSRFMLLGR